jgi:hypothetical protein
VTPTIRQSLLTEAAESTRKSVHLIYLVRAATDGMSINAANLSRLNRAAQHLADAAEGVRLILKENP